jgi:hypothetical protein
VLLFFAELIAGRQDCGGGPAHRLCFGLLELLGLEEIERNHEDEAVPVQALP